MNRKIAFRLISFVMMLSLFVSVFSLRVFAEEDSQQETVPIMRNITVTNGFASYDGENAITQAKEGDKIWIRFNESLLDQYHELQSWSSPQMDLSSFGTTPMINITVPASDISITANIGENKAAIDASIAESRSVEESRSIAESQSVSEQESIRQSESVRLSEEESSRQAYVASVSVEASIRESQLAAARIDLDGFKIVQHLNNIAAPAGFSRSNDADTFDQETECFYSSKFKMFVYYAEKDGEAGYYVYDAFHHSLIPFVSFRAADGMNYIVSAPYHRSDLPKEVVGETQISLTAPGSSQPVSVPAWNIQDSEKVQYPLICLVGEDGSKNWFAYEGTGEAATLTPWKDFQERLSSEAAETAETETESETGSESVSETLTLSTAAATTEAAKPRGSLLGNYLIWIILGILIVMLLIAAVIIVIQMSRKQEEEEREIDLEEMPEDDFILDRDRFDTAYTQEDNALDPFEVDFENAFPEEMGLNTVETTVSEAPLEGEILDREPQTVPAPDPVPVPDEGDYEEVRVRVRKTEIKDTEVYIRRKAGSHQKTDVDPQRGAMTTRYDEVLSDDFEVVDFSDRK